MENRRPLYYDGNTVKPPHPGRKELWRRERIGTGNLVPVDKTPQNTELKVCATLVCVWCDEHFDNYRVVCSKCANCQYCGLRASDFYACHICGNHWPEPRPQAERRVMRIG